MGAFLLCEMVIVFVINQISDSKKITLLNAANKVVTTQFNTVYNSFETLASTVFKGYINKPEIINAFANKKREVLYNLLKEDYTYLSSINFKQIHFHLPNNDSFLRMHKPERFGDDLTDIRYSVEYVNKYHKPIMGLEMGRVVPGFRYVYPLFNTKKEYLGSVETSFSVKAFAHKVEEVFDVHTHFLINKEVYDRKIFEEYKDYYSKSIESEAYILLVREAIRKIKQEEQQIYKVFQNDLKQTINEKMRMNKEFSLEIELGQTSEGHKHKIATFLPLFNIQNQKIAYFVVYQNSDELAHLQEESYYSYGLFTLINILIFILIYKEVNFRENLLMRIKESTQKLRQKRAELEELNNSLEVRIKKEVQKSREHELQLFEVEKMAQMGEMIGNIAHQWRQPLSAIASSSSAIKLHYELEVLNKEGLYNYLDGITRSTQYLSETIDTFRNFVKDDRSVQEASIQEVLEQGLSIVNDSLKSNNIKLHKKYTVEPIRIKTIPKELIQVFINVINNARDIILERKIKNPQIILNVENINETVVISIEDNAGGVPQEILPKVFDLYFTTKHQSRGTGIGLHMSRKIVHDHLKGKMYVHNSSLGARFVMELPLEI